MATGSAAYHWIECPHCAKQAANNSVVNGRGFEWVRTDCHLCGRPFEVRLTHQAMFEIRQLSQVQQAVTS